MRYGRDPSHRPWQTVVLIEVEWGFAFFDVDNDIFEMQPSMIWAHFTHRTPAREAVYYLGLVKIGDKSALWSGVGPAWSINGPGKSFAQWVDEYSSEAQRFVVGDKKLRRLIKSNLAIDCFNVKKYVIREVVWGLNYALPFLVHEAVEKITIRCQRPPLPLCQGLECLMKKYKIMIPPEAVDRDFVSYAGVLQRVEELWFCRCTEMRKACDKLVPGISGMIKDNSRYVEVMAKILTPSLVEAAYPHKWLTPAGEPWFTPDEMQKIETKDAAADDARKKVEDDYKLADMIKDNLHDYRGYPESKAIYLEKLRSYEAKAKRGQKRSHTEMA